MSLLRELKRRNVFRVALAYLVLAWLVLQVADVLVDALELPGAWSKGVIGLLVIGFIPTLVFSWVYELTPEGIKRETEVSRDTSITSQTGQKLNLAVVIMLGIAIALFAADRFLGPREAPMPAPAAVEAAPASTEVANTVPVVAVLPLQALSTEDEGRFLASGLHDDLLTRLARLDAFRVISRTSVMEYANTTKNLRQIGQELGARFIVEGGLQAIGGRVRINAQLIDANTDEHLWADTYERPLTPANLFEVQGEIAAAIADATHATLSPRDVATLDEIPTNNLAAYQAYLRGNLNTDLSRPSLYRGLEANQEAVQLDPNYADAWARLATSLVRLNWEEGGEAGTASDPERIKQAKRALDRARELKPDGLQTLLATAYYHYYGFRDYSSALIALGRAEALAPNDFGVIALRGYLLRRLGRYDEAADALLAALRAEPTFGSLWRETPITLVYADRCAEALELSTEAVRRFPDNTGVLDIASVNKLACSSDPAGARDLALRMTVTMQAEMEARVQNLVISGDLQAAAETLASLDGDFLESPVRALIANDYLAWIYRRMGNEEAAIGALALAATAAGQLEEQSYGILAEQAFHAALTGDRTAALEHGRKALEAAPADAMVTPDLRYRVIRAWATAGLLDEAMEQLAVLKQETGDAVFRFYATDPFVEPLKKHPDYASY